MGMLVGVADIAHCRGAKYFRRVEGEWAHHCIRLLYFQLRKINGFSQYAAGGTSLESAHREALACKGGTESDCRFFAEAAFFSFELADVDFPFHKGSGGKHYRPCGDRPAARRQYGLYATTFYKPAFRSLRGDNINNRILINMEIFFFFEGILRSLRI